MSAPEPKGAEDLDLLGVAFFGRHMSTQLYQVAIDALGLGRVIRAVGADGRDRTFSKWTRSRPKEHVRCYVKP
jgi:hypothetical protein